MSDEKEYTINISPEILELLGPSLYTNIYYILAELIANAYDADARNVYVIQKDDCIIVEDDGYGMSYEKGIKKYLQVAKPTRVTEKDDTTPLGRKKMGRKGVGKLAALSVSKNVLVMTQFQDELSGFILSRTVPSDNRLQPIKDEDIHFEYIEGHGTSIVMLEPEYNLHKTLDAQKRNLLRMFPVVGPDFRIHLISERGTLVLDSYEGETITDLVTLITVGDQFEQLSENFSIDYSDIVDKVLMHFDESDLSELITMRDKQGNEVECVVSVKGWIGTYRTTSNRKKEPNDFPDNYLSLFANGKLGQFNIIPLLGQNRLNESYIVGQLHVDVFEQTNLPDMALSNRQGYKSEDPRYQAAVGIIRPNLFSKILNMRTTYTDRKNKEKEERKLEELKKKEEELKRQAREFTKTVADKISNEIDDKVPEDIDIDIEHIAQESVDENLSLLGLKRQIDAGKKKILISHTSGDKALADIIYNLLIHNNVDPADIIYTNSEDEDSRIPEGYGIYDYLREFFVESSSSQMINVIFVTSEESSQKWAPVCEVGAAWVTRAEHKIFNVNRIDEETGELRTHRPDRPLDNASEWHSSRILGDEIHMNRRDADLMKVKIREICRSLGVNPKSDEDILRLISSSVVVE